MFKRSLASMGLASSPRRSAGRRWGGRVLLPILAFLGWRYRDGIKAFVRDQLGRWRATSAS